VDLFPLLELLVQPQTVLPWSLFCDARKYTE
jgi:hypothetical protein